MIDSTNIVKIILKNLVPNSYKALSITITNIKQLRSLGKQSLFKFILKDSYGCILYFGVMGFWACPLSSIPKKHLLAVRSVSVLRWNGEAASTNLGTSERVSLNHWTGMSRSLPMFSREDGNRPSLRMVVFLSEYWTSDKVHKPINNKWLFHSGSRTIWPSSKWVQVQVFVCLTTGP
jgi:hypothetical protein